jgi:hypothetical protein
MQSEELNGKQFLEDLGKHTSVILNAVLKEIVWEIVV